MAEKEKKTFMILKSQNEWLRRVSDEKEVDQSFLLRRAISYYQAEGMERDQILRKMSEGEI